MEDLQLHFVDTSAVYNSHTGGSIIAQDQNDSVSLELTPGGTTPNAFGNSLQTNNPKAFKMYKQRTAELTAMKERVSKVEKLLSENLENMDLQSKQYEQQIVALNKTNKDKQTALEASEKSRARDKMIIKFREERIAELEARLQKANDPANNDSMTTDQTNATEFASLKKQLADAKTEIS